MNRPNCREAAYWIESIGRHKINCAPPRFKLFLSPMPDDSFKEFVLDQLSGLPDIRARTMFGAHGVYCGETFFGIVDEGRLYFKTNVQSQSDYTARGMGPIAYKSKGKTVTMSFHEVPPEVLENPHEIVLWAGKAIRLAAEKPKKRSRNSSGIR
ncbi:MAG: TfoX/Sxy family protein [Limisphaerales bacterium]